MTKFPGEFCFGKFSQKCSSNHPTHVFLETDGRNSEFVFACESHSKYVHKSWAKPISYEEYEIIRIIQS